MFCYSGRRITGVVVSFDAKATAPTKFLREPKKPISCGSQNLILKKETCVKVEILVESFILVPPLPCCSCRRPTWARHPTWGWVTWWATTHPSCPPLSRSPRHATISNSTRVSAAPWPAPPGGPSAASDRCAELEFSFFCKSIRVLPCYLAFLINKKNQLL
jgi:hypothetical protein